jgi:hypothetical protein
MCKQDSALQQCIFGRLVTFLVQHADSTLSAFVCLIQLPSAYPTTTFLANPTIFGLPNYFRLTQLPSGCSRAHPEHGHNCFVYVYVYVCVCVCVCVCVYAWMYYSIPAQCIALYKYSIQRYCTHLRTLFCFGTADMPSCPHQPRTHSSP